MRRAPLICTLILACLPATAPATRGGMPHAATTGVRVTACIPALEQEDRSATFEARARRMGGSERIQVRFTLLQRTRGSREWHRLIAPGLDEWQTSDPGVSRYSYSKTIQNLAAPAAYRAVVRFRWLDADGSVTARARVASRSCRQPDMRPDLVPVLIDPLPALGDVPARYAVVVVNHGRSDAGAFAVGLRAGETELAPQELPGLGAGELRVLMFSGPPCVPGAPLTATVDADRAVDERDEDDNLLVAACQP
jgi:hypothetical protein